MLEYDNSAFYYFTLSLISIYLVPVTLMSLQQVCLPFEILPCCGNVFEMVEVTFENMSCRHVFGGRP